MRSVRAVFAASVLGAGSLITGAGAAQAGFSDAICPEATHYVQALTEVDRLSGIPRRQAPQHSPSP
jgi:hypothetical protein